MYITGLSNTESLDEIYNQTDSEWDTSCFPKFNLTNTY